ncbi:MAG: hypothetical protein HC910_07885 [Spirulinaceae cyanobacterium SM2_1_0]|nr:hypothetical protein [Spirulinaceae cyanobacterium SM2_1_0]
MLLLGFQAIAPCRSQAGARSAIIGQVRIDPFTRHAVLSPPSLWCLPVKPFALSAIAMNKKKPLAIPPRPPRASTPTTEAAPSATAQRQRPQSLTPPDPRQPLVALSLLAVLGTVFIIGLTPQSKSRSALLLPTARPTAARRLNGFSPAWQPLTLPRPHLSPQLLAVPSPPAQYSPPAIPPEQSQVLYRLAQLQAQSFIASPAMTTVATAAIPLALRDALALALADSPTAQATDLNYLLQRAASPPTRALNIESASLAAALADWQAAQKLPPHEREPAIARLQPPPKVWQQMLARRARASERADRAIAAYHRLLLAQAGLQASQRSLADAERLLARQQSLVAAGRQTRATLQLHQQNVANAERRLLATQSLLEGEQLQLLADLDIDARINIRFIASENLVQAIATAAATQLDPAALWQLAQQQHPDYLAAQLTGAVASLKPLEPVVVPTTVAMDDVSGDLPRDRPELVIPTLSQQQLQQTHQELYRAIHDALLTVRRQAAQLEQFQQALQTAATELAAQETAQAAGNSRGDEIQAQRQLALQRQAVVQAQIAYLDAIAALDRAAGLTLYRWEQLGDRPR